ncbi:hypothetical protein [Telmatospirillum sp.]|uniref:hypothetical protein n=1 Tax=Telmatospirillum sp. TaxID=2079197 RepID=UPI00283B68AE|nr:hypothetical protein [Telmatospirillum sp.]MDR3435097.1 hypothetical protein [Telmatospirillum sp.]
MTPYTPQDSQDSSSTDTTAKTGADKAVAGAGVGGGLLAASTAQYLMQLDQDMTSSTSAGSQQATSTAYQAIGTMNIMQEVANDPDFANSWAGHLSATNTLIAVQLPMNADGTVNTTLMDDPNWFTQFDAKIDQAQAIVNSFQQQAQALYNSDKSQGKSGAQTVADILELRLAQPQSYWDAVDPTNIEANAKDDVQTQLNILKQAMAQNSTTSGGQTSTTSEITS